MDINFIPHYTQFSDNGKLLAGTMIAFLAFVPAGFLDSGWSWTTTYIHGMYINREHVVKAVRDSIRATEITGVDWKSIQLYPYFGTVEWWMPIYKAEEVML